MRSGASRDDSHRTLAHGAVVIQVLIELILKTGDIRTHRPGYTDGPAACDVEPLGLVSRTGPVEHVYRVTRLTDRHRRKTRRQRGSLARDQLDGRSDVAFLVHTTGNEAGIRNDE